ncbi:MAG TPA: hypothetical protein VGD21_12480 [Lysobacter sp.]
MPDGVQTPDEHRKLKNKKAKKHVAAKPIAAQSPRQPGAVGFSPAGGIDSKPIG